MTRERCFFLFLILGQLHFFIVDSASSSCPTNCGGIQIPYPFGIGVGCYLSKWYELECRNNSTPILSVVKKEVVNISLPGYYRTGLETFDSYGSIRIKNPITSKGCSRDGKEEDAAGSPLNLNLTGSPFYIGRNNNLLAVGCNFSASLITSEPSMVGCSSSCDTAQTSSSTPLLDYLSYLTCQIKGWRINFRAYSLCDARKNKHEAICNGIGCCQTSTPDEFQQVVGVRIDDENTRRGCKVAFLTDEAYSFRNRYDPKQLHATRYATLELGWFIHTTNVSFIDSLWCLRITEGVDYDYSTERKCGCEYIADSNSTTCACNIGYRGNPYILDGCKDVDTCLELGGRVCSRGYTCVNLPGDYHCVFSKTIAIAIGIGAGFGSLILIGGVYWLYKFVKRRRRLNQKRMFFKRNGGLLLQQQLVSTKGNVEKTKIFSSKDLEKATENFSSDRVLGQGGQGMVYKGMLVDGGIVAVKKSKVVDEDKLEEFINEVVILSHINHRNIVKLLGCCLETEVPILVYEFIPNGNLFEHLHDEFDDYTMTTWEVRLRIAVDVAGALSYLHSAASSPIYHRDIKSTNIMLDEKYRAKVSDFGTSRSVTVDHTHLTTVVSGTVGYVDPEYFQSNQFTDKSDVYSFGVVLVELITGAKPISFMRSQENRTLATYFITAMKENRLDEIIDARIREESKLAQITATAKLARRCLNLKGRKRPNMKEVSVELERIRSSNGDSQSQVHLFESDDEEETVEVNVGVQTLNNVAGNDTLATSFSDAEPLFPRQTW